MPRYNHAFSLGFSLESNTDDGADVTHEMLMQACLKRLADLSRGETGPEGVDMVGACDAPWDSYEVTD